MLGTRMGVKEGTSFKGEESRPWARENVRLVKVSVVKPEDPNSNPKTHTLEVKN